MKAKTGAESPPAPSSSALAAKLREIDAALESIEPSPLTDSDQAVFGESIEKIRSIAAALESSQATDKAAAVEKVKALPVVRISGKGYYNRVKVNGTHIEKFGEQEIELFDIEDLPNEPNSGDWNISWIVVDYRDIHKLLAILTDSEPKEEEAGSE